MRSLPVCKGPTKISTKQQVHSKVRDSPGGLKKNTLLPGQEVSVDHFTCSTLGRLYTGYGKTEDSSLFKGGCIFSDNTTSWVQVEHQLNLTTHETLGVKERFEFASRDYGVIIQEYLSNNEAAFTSHEFSNHLRQFEKTIRFTGVGAHHHNGIAEKDIQAVVSVARTLLLHSAIHWPDFADAQLWPMAVDHAAFLHNHMPRKDTGMSPHDLFTKLRCLFHQFDLPVWNDDHQCFESTPELESDNLLADGLLLQPDHPSYVAFKHQQKATSNEKDVG
jgi:hypothetical protein